MLDSIQTAVAAALSLGTLFGVIILMTSVVDWYNCSTYAEVTGRETKYVGLSCYTKLGDIWYSSDEYNKIISSSSPIAE